jgi:hypothetical protein
MSREKRIALAKKYLQETQMDYYARCFVWNIIS